MKEISVEQLLDKQVVDCDGRKVGRIHDIRVDRGEESCPVEAYLVGERALLQRLASWAVPAHIGRSIQARLARPFAIPWDQMDLGDPHHPRATVRKKELHRTR